MITYNHEPFIAQAIESILSQQTQYSFELIIGEDCGTDNTRKICDTYATKYPDKIKLLPSDKNYGPSRNYIRTHEAATGKYIALCEGDDYWIDNKKLQVQVEFLETNPDYSLCFHDVFHLNGSKRTKSGKWSAPDTSDINYLLSHRGYITTLSVVFKSHSSVLELLKNSVQSSYLDFFLYVAVAQYGLFKFFPNRMGVYRIHQGGIWSNLGLIKATEKTIQGYRILYTQISESQQEQLKIKYLTTLEDFFLQAGTGNSSADTEHLIIKEMNIAPTVIEYIKQQTEEQNTVAFLVKKIPIKRLVEAIFYKIRKRF